ncbi:hypothetical protein Q4503_16370 [Colwellia sp. 6_MG-2023]|uniref:DUF7446 family protein n=1 Tax=Colwellia sp. 6_MG-2023 TaxID=3062676 RepID=UPI0026E2713B|nr:hypothetical protein [Colwellia sp. 6_MG-2023]MDO6489271.1 hypothetical protein [Colwellia sp. 6_MG-2023]
MKPIDHFDLQEMASLVCGMTEAESDAVINDDEDFDTPLLNKLNVDFEQFSAVAEAILNNNSLKIGFSPMTSKVYLGLQRENVWVGHKADITSDFIQVMEHKFPINTAQNISVGGVNKFRFLSLDMDKKITVNGKDPFAKPELIKSDNND